MSYSIEHSSGATLQRIRDARGCIITDRPWSSYPNIFALLKIPNEHWHGKKILDIGSGEKYDNPTNTFPGAISYAIDPEFSIAQDDLSASIREGGNSAFNKRCGAVQEIPYDDNMFDLVLASYVLLLHIPIEQFPHAIIEMLRVMKLNGEIRIAPFKGEVLLPKPFQTALEEFGFFVDYSQRGSEGLITVINYKVKRTDSLDMTQSKDNVWKELHNVFVDEALRD